MGVPAPDALRFVPVAALVGTALLKGMCLMEDDFDEGAPRPDTLLGSCCPLRFQKSPVGVPAPGALHVLSCFILAEDGSAETFTTIAASILVRMASPKDMPDGSRHRRR